MAKKNKFKRNKSDIPSNIFNGGGIITDMYTQNISGPKLSQSGLPSSYQTGMKYGNMGNTSNVGSNLMSGLGEAALGAGIGFLGNAGGNLIAGGKSSGIGNTIGSLGNTIGGALMTVNPLVGGLTMGATSLLGDAFNAAFGSKLNKERIAQAENEINAVKSFNADASNFDDLTQQISNQPVIAGFSQSDIGSDGLFSNKAKNKYRDLLAQKQFAEAWADRSIANNATNLQQQQINTLLQNSAAYGGLLDMNNSYSDGEKIYIKPENRGKFTALKERTGKSATWFKEHGTPAQKLNAAKWEHAFGGDLLTNGTVFSNGVTTIGNGGTHEESPYEGVQMGIDSQGVPNLVEEGEVIFNDYVFSNRIRVPDAVRNKYKLRGTKDMTFADAAKKATKESEERPNDPISQRGLEDIMNKLANEQEVMRKQRNTKSNNKFGFGGKKDKDWYLNMYNSWLTNPENTGTNALDETIITTKDRLERAAKVEQDFQKNKEKNKQIDDLIDRDNLLRYAPAFGSALGVGYGLLSKPNYSRADALAQFAQNAGKITPISYDPLGNYLTYRPVDMNYIANRMAAQAGATRRNIMNTSGGNRANAIGSLLAADYNSQIAQADAIRQGEDTNWNRLMQTETFNRGTNQYNSEAALKAAMANQEARMKASQLGLSGYTTAMQMKDAIDAQRNASISANLTNLFDSLGNIGIDAYNRKDRDMLLRAGVFGTLGEKPQGWSEKRWTDYKKALNETGYRNGGKLKKKRGGFTY